MHAPASTSPPFLSLRLRSRTGRHASPAAAAQDVQQGRQKFADASTPPAYKTSQRERKEPGRESWHISCLQCLRMACKRRAASHEWSWAQRHGMAMSAPCTVASAMPGGELAPRCRHSDGRRTVVSVIILKRGLQKLCICRHVWCYLHIHKWRDTARSETRCGTFCLTTSVPISQSIYDGHISAYIQSTHLP